jgi:hypothetical protein
MKSDRNKRRDDDWRRRSRHNPAEFWRSTRVGRRCPFAVVVVVLGLGLGWPGAGYEARAEVELPPVRVILDRMVDRAAAWTREDRVYSYQKRSVLEQLDAHGRPIDSIEKEYQVELIRGIPFPRLVRIQGRDLTAEEIRRENDRERALRDRVTGTDPAGMVERREPLVTHALLERYEFTLDQVKQVGDRRLLVLAFEPRQDGVPTRTIQDRILARLGGRVWVDDEEAEVARIEVTLREAFSLGWFGMLGSLQQCELFLERQRMPDGVWIPTRQSLLLIGRRLLAPMRYRTTEEIHGFEGS